jgi:Zn-dependent protease
VSVSRGQRWINPVDLSIDQVRNAILFLIAIILSTAVHEFGHAWAATRLGDSTPRLQGRLTLMPHRHIDPIGTIIMPLLMAFSMSPIAWGKPVMTDGRQYTRRVSRATGYMLVAIAGPIMNLIMATVISLLLVAGMRTGVVDRDLASAIVRYLVSLNLMLMFFNLLPIPPLDGGAVLAWVLPESMQGMIQFLQRWGFLILLVVVVTPQIAGPLFYPAGLLQQAWARGIVALVAL